MARFAAVVDLPSASIAPGDYAQTEIDAQLIAVFNIGGNKYRLVCHMAYPFRRVLIKFIGTHKDYDKIVG
jgi:mRNA-degrading endonuclease HigB of HigAB toxin-antitoxin module